MFNQFKELEKQVRDLELQVWELRNPPKFEVGDKVGVRRGTYWSVSPPVSATVISRTVLPPQKKVRSTYVREYNIFIHNLCRVETTFEHYLTKPE